MKNRFLSLQVILLACVITVTTAQAMEEPTKETIATIEPFNKDRDLDVVKAIIANDYKYLAYESMGYPEGTTEKYLLSTKYKTDVIRVDNKTVGFVNYLSNEVHFLTFYIVKAGIIHLLGVDADHRKLGLGTQLLKHAVQELEKTRVPQMYISVARSNATAKNLYIKAGFTSGEELIPEEYKKYLPETLVFTKNYNIPAHELPQGNIIQRHPRKAAALTVATIVGLIALKKGGLTTLKTYLK